jgi:hypothetical protein
MSLSAWLAGARALLRSNRGGTRAPALPQKRDQPVNTANEAAPAEAQPTAFDVEQEIRSVLGYVIASWSQPVRLEIAVQPELMLYGDRAAFRQVLAALVQPASSHASMGRILVTASRSGECAQVNVTDDGIGAERRARRDALRAIEHLLARQGGTLEIESWPDQGSTVLTRWPMSGPAKIEASRVPSVVRERVSTG